MAKRTARGALWILNIFWRQKETRWFWTIQFPICSHVRAINQVFHFPFSSWEAWASLSLVTKISYEKSDVRARWQSKYLWMHSWQIAQVCKESKHTSHWYTILLVQNIVARNEECHIIFCYWLRTFSSNPRPGPILNKYWSLFVKMKYKLQPSHAEKYL